MFLAGCPLRLTVAQASPSYLPLNCSRNFCWPGGLIPNDNSQVICECGALYERTEFHSAHETDSFDCPSCGHTLEMFSDVKAPRSVDIWSVTEAGSAF